MLIDKLKESVDKNSELRMWW